MSGPSLVPSFDVTVYVVLNDFGKLGRAYVETDEENSDLEAVVSNLLRDEYSKPVRVVAFNTAEGWARDVSEDVAWELLTRALDQAQSLPESAHQFAAFHLART